MRAYDPLTLEELGRNAARALMSYPAAPLAPEAITDAGVYTLHYRGDFEPYADLGETPIYVGQAQRLSARLRQHANSIDQVENLSLDDFECRWLVLAHVWITLTEQILIDEYRPVWNYITGLGNHAPGSGRGAQKRSQWDTLHPGRPWAAGLSDLPEGPDGVLASVYQHLESDHR